MLCSDLASSASAPASNPEVSCSTTAPAGGERSGVAGPARGVDALPPWPARTRRCPGANSRKRRGAGSGRPRRLVVWCLRPPGVEGLGGVAAFPVPGKGGPPRPVSGENAGWRACSGAGAAPGGPCASRRASEGHGRTRSARIADLGSFPQFLWSVHLPKRACIPPLVGADPRHRQERDHCRYPHQHLTVCAL